MMYLLVLVNSSGPHWLEMFSHSHNVWCGMNEPVDQFKPTQQLTGEANTLKLVPRYRAKLAHTLSTEHKELAVQLAHTIVRK